MNLANMVVMKWYFEGGRYERYQRLVVLQGSSAKVEFFGYNWAGDGGGRALSASTYKLLVDGVERASVAVAANTVNSQFTLDLQPIADGWHELDIVGAPTETCAQFWVYVQKGGSPVNRSSVPVTLGTHSLVFDTHGLHCSGTVPAVFTPTVIPLKARETPDFNTALTRIDLVQTQLSPTRPDDVYRPTVTSTGLMTTANTQAYFWSDFVAKMPRVALLDGPRGRGCVVMPTMLLTAHAGGTWFGDPWRIGKVDGDGTVKTLAGYRHRQPASFYSGPQDLELVGDWSAIPVERRGFHELWGFAFDPRTLATNPNTAPIDGEQPHLVGPTMWVADTQNHRILKLVFSPVSRDVPPKVTEFITGLSEPWSVVYAQAKLYVSERTASRISVFDPDTGARLSTLLQGAALMSVSTRDRFPYRTATLEACQREPIVGPEGMAFQDGWLYVGSWAQRQVRRINLATQAVEVVVANLIMDNNSFFAQIAVGDGSFGPRGSVFVVTWSVVGYGYPHAYLPDGRPWDYIAGSSEYGLPWAFSSYPTAVAVGRGRMVHGAVNEGLLQMSRRLPSDARLDRNKYVAGAQQYAQRGLDLIHGSAGWSFHGQPLPWGTSPEIDYYLEAQGHRRA